MRILHFFKTAYPDTMGGIEQVIHQVATGCAKHNITTNVLALSPEKSPQNIALDGYTLNRVPLDLQIQSTGISLQAFSRFAELAKAADVVHYHFPWPFMDVVHFATRCKKPSIVTYHSDIVRQKNLLKLYRPLMKRFLTSVDYIVPTSQNYVASSNVLKEFPNKIRVIPLGLDKATYPSPSPQILQKWREKLGEKFFLFVGVLRYYKGLHILLEASKGMDFPLVIVGSGPEEQALNQQAQAAGLRNVHFLGLLPDEDKIALLNLCYAFVFPSHLRSEAFGVSLLEAAMFGKPMISCEIGTGTTYINQADKTGLVVPPNDPFALMQAMQYLWDHPENANTMGQNAEQRYWQSFTADQMVNAYIDLYKTLANQPRPRK